MEPGLKRKMTSLANERSIGFLFHLITITITGTIILYLIQVIVYQPEILENRFLLSPMTPHKLSTSYDAPAVVKTSFLLSDFRQFDTLANNFECEGTLWFEFDPLLVSLDTISHFEFENATIKYKSKPKIRMVDKSVLASYDILINFNTELDYSFFPMDDHMLALILVNKTVSPHKLLFEADKGSFKVNADIQARGWKYFYHDVFTGYTHEQFNSTKKFIKVEYPALQFSIFYVRAGLKYTLVLMLPMLIFIIIMLTAFSYDPVKYFSSIMVANGASLSGLIAYRFVIENMSPKVGYFMLSDYFFLIFLTIACLLFLISIFSTNLSGYVKKWLILFVHISLILLFSTIAWYVLKFSFYAVDIL